jgi:hypothetical protein
MFSNFLLTSGQKEGKEKIAKVRKFSSVPVCPFLALRVPV